MRSVMSMFVLLHYQWSNFLLFAVTIVVVSNNAQCENGGVQSNQQNPIVGGST